MADARSIPIKNDLDIVAARVEGRNLAKDMGFGIIDQARIATAISELARNVVTHAGAGRCLIEDISDPHAARVQVVVEDHGPGIANIELAMQDGYSTGKGLGAGLPGAKRLVHRFEISSVPGHTRVAIEMVRTR